MLHRRHFLQSLAAAPALAQTGKKRPNFVILFTDDQRFDTIRALGNAEIQTPNMDRLVKRGVAFTHASIMGGTQGAVCVPSRAMLMTGQSLFRAARNTGATPGDKSKPGSFLLMPEMLRKNGYRTFHTGKWHNGPALHARCFTDGGNIFFGGMGDQLQMPVQEFDPTGAYPKEKAHPGDRFSSEMFADSAIDFLKKQNGQDPFFLYCAFTSPHDPRMAPKQFADLYKAERIKLPENFLPEHPFDNGELKVRDELLAPFPRTPEVVREQIAAYYAMISEVDAQIGRVLDAIEKSPFADNTYIIFAGDNGLAVGQHGLFGKQNVYDHSVRVPLVVAGPGIPRGQRSDAFVYLFDVLPTVMEWAGLTSQIPFDALDGQSLMGPIKNPQERGRLSVFYAYRTFQRAIRNREWKLIRYTVAGKEKLQLFHISQDPWEKHDLAGDPAQAQRIRQLSSQLHAWQLRTDDPIAS